MSPGDQAASSRSSRADRSLFAQYIGSGLLDFGFRLSHAALEGKTVFHLLHETTVFVRQQTRSLGGFASLQDAPNGPIQLVPDTSDGFDDKSEVLPLLEAKVLQRAHQGHLGSQGVFVNQRTVQFAALPVYRQNGFSLAMGFASRDPFHPRDFEIVNVVRNLAAPVVSRVASRSFLSFCQAARVMQDARNWVGLAQRSYDDELERQNCMAIATERIYSLAPFMGLSSAIQDGIALLHIVARNAEQVVLSRTQVSLLEEALAEFQDVNLDSGVIDRHWRRFVDAGIDLDLPFRGDGTSEEAHDGGA